jgi:hypothetical protein
MDAEMLDGNAAAGLLREVFAVEMTTAIGTCNGCGATEPLGAVRVFISAGAVLRCPHCDNVLVKITKSETRLWLACPGIQSLELTTG